MIQGSRTSTGHGRAVVDSEPGPSGPSPPAWWSSGQPSDERLVTAARTGDKDAFGELVARHRALALTLAARLLGSRELATDAVSEATVAALVGLDRLRTPARFGAWYAGIALNVARHMARERQRWGAVARRAAVRADQPHGGISPEEWAETSDLGARVRRAVADLAPGQRAAVLAFYWQGLTHAEAAVELGVTPNAVKARLHDARVALAPSIEADRRPEVSGEREVRRREVVPMPTVTEPGWVEVSVSEVRRSTSGDGPGGRPLHTVVLAEPGGDRRLPIWVGASEATMLACTLESVEFPRPMTHVLSASLLAAAGAHLTEVRITSLAESTFYAVVVVEGPSGLAEVDARPSDALTLALVCGAPIRVDAGLLDDPAAADRTEWLAYESDAADIVAEVQQHQAELTAMLALEQERDEPGPDQ